MKYQKAKRLSATEFKRLTGVKRKTFPYRNRGRRLGLRANLIAGIYHYELGA